MKPDKLDADSPNSELSCHKTNLFDLEATIYSNPAAARVRHASYFHFRKPGVVRQSSLQAAGYWLTACWTLGLSCSYSYPILGCGNLTLSVAAVGLGAGELKGKTRTVLRPSLDEVWDHAKPFTEVIRQDHRCGLRDEDYLPAFLPWITTSTVVVDQESHFRACVRWTIWRRCDGCRHLVWKGVVDMQEACQLSGRSLVFQFAAIYSKPIFRLYRWLWDANLVRPRCM
jgi:hypothetical protein